MACHCFEIHLALLRELGGTTLRPAANSNGFPHSLHWALLDIFARPKLLHLLFLLLAPTPQPRHPCQLKPETPSGPAPNLHIYPLDQAREGQKSTPHAPPSSSLRGPVVPPSSPTKTRLLTPESLKGPALKPPHAPISSSRKVPVVLSPTPIYSPARA